MVRTLSHTVRKYGGYFIEQESMSERLETALCRPNIVVLEVDMKFERRRKRRERVGTGLIAPYLAE